MFYMRTKRLYRIECVPDKDIIRFHPFRSYDMHVEIVSVRVWLSKPFCGCGDTDGA